MPGRYSSRLILGAGEGPVASVPVTLTVRASWQWAFGFMVLGLAFLGLLLLLAGRATLNERLAEALTEQRELHELLESSPPTLADRPLARQAKEDVAAAVESLARPRPFGIEDPQLLGSMESLALLQPHPDLSGLEAKLDLIDAELEAGFSGADCLDQLTALSGELLEIGNRLFSTFLLVADLTPEARLASAEHSEVAEAVTLAQRLMQEPRPLRLELRTPLEEIQVDRKVAFEVGDLGPAWGPGTSIQVDFGDGSPALLRNAEELRQEPLLQHRYTRPQRVEVRIVATQRTAEGIFEPGGEIVGEGRLAITVGPSPISLARSLASFFLSVRFALALAVGLLIQGWRLYDKHPFGSRPRDYLEAFALGVGTQGLVEGFSTALAQLASGG